MTWGTGAAQNAVATGYRVAARQRRQDAFVDLDVDASAPGQSPRTETFPEECRQSSLRWPAGRSEKRTPEIPSQAEAIAYFPEHGPSASRRPTGR
jgi:hypothetical protein